MRLKSLVVSMNVEKSVEKILIFQDGMILYVLKMNVFRLNLELSNLGFQVNLAGLFGVD
jgi:hypothetical protein